MFDPKLILDYMDTALDNAKECRDILLTLEIDILKYEQTIDAMIVSRAKFYEAHQKELR